MTELKRSKKDERTSLDEAIIRVLDELTEKGGLNVSQAAKAASLHWQTADKVMTLLREISSRLEGKSIDEYAAGKSRMYVLGGGTNIDQFPKEVRKEIVRFEYPEISENHRMLVKLLLEGASCEKMAKKVDDTTEISELIESSRIMETKDGRIYLTDLGLRLARGTLKIYSDILL